MDQLKLYILPEPSDGYTSTSPSSVSLALRYSRLPNFFFFSNLDGSKNPLGVDHLDPDKIPRAGFTNIKEQTNAATGFPGNPKIGFSLHDPIANGRPGLTAILQFLSVPCTLISLETWSSSPADAPPEITITSAVIDARSNLSFNKTSSSGIIPQSTV